MKSRILLILWFIGCFARLIAQEDPAKTVSVEDRIKNFVDRIAPKIKLNKHQTDSLAIIYIQYMDDLEKYHAGNNAKVIVYMMKNRDDKVKNLLRDSVKFEKYLVVMADINNQHEQPPQQQPLQNQPPGGHQHEMGNGRGF